ncbi:MAG: RsmG family class I SAM-dependent methyltransferase [Planctomycetota bacterium]
MTLFDDLRQKGLAFPAAFAELFDERRLEWFGDFLSAGNKSGGFFSEADAGRILERHLYECMVLVATLAAGESFSPHHAVADVGSGPGLPGYLFACLRTPPPVTLIDSSRRRLGLLERAVQRLDPTPKIRFVYDRVEALSNRFDLVTARAFVPYPHVVEVVGGIIRHDGWLALAMAGSEPPEAGDADYLRALGFGDERTVVLPELEFLGERSLRWLRRVGDPAPGYPRRWPRIRREIVRRRGSAELE